MAHKCASPSGHENVDVTVIIEGAAKLSGSLRWLADVGGKNDAIGSRLT